MREFKFRARWIDTGKVVEDFMEDSFLDALNDECYIVEQWTGELDSNKTEIYEGDKVYIWGGEKDGEYYELMMNGVIEFKYGQFIVRGISGTYYSFGEFDHIEVRNN